MLGPQAFTNPICLGKAGHQKKKNSDIFSVHTFLPLGLTVGVLGLLLIFVILKVNCTFKNWLT